MSTVKITLIGLSIALLIAIFNLIHLQTQNKKMVKKLAVKTKALESIYAQDPPLQAQTWNMYGVKKKLEAAQNTIKILEAQILASKQNVKVLKKQIAKCPVPSKSSVP